MLPADFHFLRPDWFYALIPLALLAWRLWSHRLRRSQWETVCDPALLPALLTHGGGSGPAIPVILLALGWLLAVTALAGPTWNELPQPLYRTQQARVIVLDLSRSMDATDLKPSRLAQARFKVIDLLRGIKEGQTGLVAFAGEAFTVSPLTDDTATITALIPSLDSSLMPRTGTRTDLALAHAEALLKQANSLSGEVILVSDSGAPDGPALAATLRLRDAGYTLSVFALGTTQGAPIPGLKGGFVNDREGTVVMPGLRLDALRKLAAVGGGRLVVAGNDDSDVQALLDTVLFPPQSVITNHGAALQASDHYAVRWREEGPWLLLLLLPLAALGFRRGWLGIAMVAVVLPLAPGGPAIAAEARADRQSLLSDETLHLSISILGRYRGDPDFSALENDFEVLDVSRSSRINKVNGKLQARTEWLLTLAPRHSGTLIIPGIEVGGELTRPLTVQARAAESNGGNRDILVELSVEPDKPYVQAQTRLVLRIFHAVSLIDAKVDEPQVGDTPLQRLGEDRAYRSERYGSNYRVIERRWVLFPQHAGSLDIPALTLSAEVRTPQTAAAGDKQTYGGALSQTRRLRVRSNSLRLAVKPRPANTLGRYWLPAQNIELQAAWQPDPPLFRVGEPVTRIFTLTGYGASAAQLPNLGTQPTKGLRIYPDQPLSKDSMDGDSVVGQRVFKAALVPSRPGLTTLPGLALHWWDTARDLEQVIRIPDRQIEVLAAVGDPQPTQLSQPQAIAGTKEGPGESISDTPMTTGSTLPYRTLPELEHLNWLHATLGIAWLLTLLMWLRERRRNRADGLTPPHSPPASISGPSQVRSMLHRGCRDHDPKLSRDALLAWGMLAWPDSPPRSLGALARRLPNATTRQAVLALDQALYQDPGQWRSSAERTTLERLVQAIPKQQPQRAVPGGLPTLYPRS